MLRLDAVATHRSFVFDYLSERRQSMVNSRAVRRMFICRLSGCGTMQPWQSDFAHGALPSNAPTPPSRCRSSLYNNSCHLLVMFQTHNATANAALLVWNAFSARVRLESYSLLFGCGTCKTQTGTNNQVVEAFVTHVECRSQSAPTLSAAG
jgi:hypothetical protein